MPKDEQPQRNSPEDGNGEGPKLPPRMSRGAFSWIILIALGLMLVVMFTRNMASRHEISYDEFMQHVRNGNVESIEIREESLLAVKLRRELPQPPTDEVQVKYPYVAENFREFRNEVLAAKPADAPLEILDKRNTSMLLTFLLQMIPWLLLIALIWFLLIRQLRQAGAGAGMLGNFGRSRHRITTKEHTNITFANVAGIDEAKEEVYEIVEFLKNPKRFERLGGRIPRGVLLVGEPGCGKTLLAKAIAGEADVPFFSISGSDFVEMFVGVGASRVRDLFRQAKENSPCIVFLDEIDAVGRRKRGHGYRRRRARRTRANAQRHPRRNGRLRDQRSSHRHRRHQPRRRARSGVGAPRPFRSAGVRSAAGRERAVSRSCACMRNEGQNRQAAGRRRSCRSLARATPMFSGADLAAIINESALLATLGIGKNAVDLDDLEEARDKIQMGPGETQPRRRGKGSRTDGVSRGRPRRRAGHAGGHRPGPQGQHYSARSRTAERRSRCPRRTA